jgi:hypothetical protein
LKDTMQLAEFNRQRRSETRYVEISCPRSSASAGDPGARACLISRPGIRRQSQRRYRERPRRLSFQLIHLPQYAR